MICIQSEIQPLKKVIVHRPYYSLSRLTPTNCQEFLFDDVLWPEKAAKEHDHFTRFLTEQGIEVLWIENLLKEALSQEEAKHYLIQQCVGRAYQGSRVEKLFSQYLNHLSIEELVQQLFSGITFGD